VTSGAVLNFGAIWCIAIFHFSFQHLGETHAQAHLYRDRRLFMEEIHGQ
jgi:hypothetical protein